MEDLMQPQPQKEDALQRVLSNVVRWRKPSLYSERFQTWTIQHKNMFFQTPPSPT